MCKTCRNMIRIAHELYIFFKVASKLEFCDRVLAEMGDEFVKKEARLRKLWQIRLAKQMSDLPHFDEVYRAVRRSLRVAGLMRE